jgi:hypothetical protein
MTKLVTLTLTDEECLDVRMALNATAIHWGEMATVARNEGRKVDADTCERIRSGYHRLWEAVNVAQEAAAKAAPDARLAWFDAAPCCQFHASGGGRALSCGGDVARRQRNTADAYAWRPKRLPTEAEGAAWRREHGE